MLHLDDHASSFKGLPVDQKLFLTDILNPTSPGTSYWESPPPGPLSDRQFARISLQIQEILDVYRLYFKSDHPMKFLDVGTGNGFIPRFIADSGISSVSMGCDLFLDGEHQTSWQLHDHTSEYSRFYSTYSNSILQNHRSSIAANSPFQDQTTVGNYSFKQLGAHDLHCLDDKYSFLYCKAIEHIHDWPRVFSELSSVCEESGLLYFKHRSFFSYLGAHRYGSTCIPWGHVLLSDDDYAHYTQAFHSERSASMCDFFFQGLSYPRHTVGQLVNFAVSSGFSLLSVSCTSPRYISNSTKFYRSIPDIYDTVRCNYPHVTSEELFSGIYHIVFKKG